jgi:HTH-type transcriptional regulator / antitoxin HigA
MAIPTNPEAFTPGEYIREELETRGWSQLDLAEILGRPPQAVNEIISGKRAITPDTAHALADAFGTSAQLWMNLDSAYQLARLANRDDSVSRKAKLYEVAPLKDMQKRGWIEQSSSITVLESQVLDFYGIKNLEQPIYLHHAARKSTDYGSITPAQLAWLYRARNLAHAISTTGKFSQSSLERALVELGQLKADVEETRKVAAVLAKAGVRFLIVAPLPHSKIDGVCFWLDEESPVIALSLRFDRIDWFWHTLIHEIAHLKNGEGKEHPTLDTQLVGADAQPFEQKMDSEKNADVFATSFLIDQSKLDNFIARVHPLYSRVKIAAFANKVHVHPGIVVGQLQHRKKIAYAHSREYVEKVKDVVTATTLTDGWGDAVFQPPT